MSEDLIRRSDAIKAVEPYLDYIEIIPFCGAKPYVREAVCGIRSKIKFIPAIEPKRGEWLEWIDCEGEVFWKCSACGQVSEASAADILYKFCPFCCADMRGKDDEASD